VEEVLEKLGFGDCEYVVGDLVLAGGDVMGLEFPDMGICCENQLCAMGDKTTEMDKFTK
jgi:hypothetical protein